MIAKWSKENMSVIPATSVENIPLPLRFCSPMGFAPTAAFKIIH
jgi:hypothetical protein